MSAYDADQWDFDGETFDGRWIHNIKTYRSPGLKGHGPSCSSNPEVGCECGEDDRRSLDREARSLGYRNHDALVFAMGDERMAELSRRHGPDICPNPRRCESCRSLPAEKAS